MSWSWHLHGDLGCPHTQLALLSAQLRGGVWLIQTLCVLVPAGLKATSKRGFSPSPAPFQPPQPAPVLTARICTWVPRGRSPPGSWHTSPSWCACTCTGDLPGRGDTHRDTPAPRDCGSSAFPAAPSPNPCRIPGPAHRACRSRGRTRDSPRGWRWWHRRAGRDSPCRCTPLREQGRGQFETNAAGIVQGGAGWKELGCPGNSQVWLGRDSDPDCVTVALLPAVRRWHQPLAPGQPRGRREARGGVGRGSPGCPAPLLPNLEWK